jgi:hypothetical protein
MMSIDAAEADVQAYEGIAAAHRLRRAGKFLLGIGLFVRARSYPVAPSD